jgi:hypothetical protein
MIRAPKPRLRAASAKSTAKSRHEPQARARVCAGGWAPSIPALIAYPAGNAGAKVLEQRERICPMPPDKISRPSPQTSVRVGVLLDGRRAQISPFVVRISKGIYDRRSRYVEHGPR